MIYKEKADYNKLQECYDFIKVNYSTKCEKEVYKDALNLYNQLSKSLIESHKDFDDATKKELLKMPLNNDGVEMDIFIFNFNKKNIEILLDVNARETLNQLKEIMDNNK